MDHLQHGNPRDRCARRRRPDPRAPGASAVDSAGNKTNTTITNTSYPLTGMITTTKKTTSVVNGVATETTTITNTYPPQANAAPQVTTTTRTYTVGAN